jgi:hypothetical protein
VVINRTLLRDLYSILQTVFDAKPLAPKPVLSLLNEHIYGHPFFNRTEQDTEICARELDTGIRVHVVLSSLTQKRAKEIYNTRRDEFFDERDLDITHLHNFIESFISDLRKLDKRFRDPILGYNSLQRG